MTKPVVLLLVEDEFLISEMVQCVLEEGGYSVKAVASGSHATEMLDGQDRISGLITDVRLGEGPDGWAVARHARHGRPALPVVYMTGDSAADWAAEGVPRSLLLQKPFAPAQMLTALSTLLNEASMILPA